MEPIIRTAVDRIVSTASASGYFERVLSAEPKSHPGTGLTFATWIGQLTPIPLHSGLAVTSVRLFMMARIYSTVDADPANDIDTNLSVAASYIMAQMIADFGIDGAELDVEGAYGDAFGSDLGYVELDGTHFRIADILIPYVCADVFDQVR